jgi:hypothetical protein
MTTLEKRDLSGKSTKPLQFTGRQPNLTSFLIIFSNKGQRFNCKDLTLWKDTEDDHEWSRGKSFAWAAAAYFKGFILESVWKD